MEVAWDIRAPLPQNVLILLLLLLLILFLILLFILLFLFWESGSFFKI